MEFVKLPAALRRPSKKSGARALRRSGQVPVIVYGKDAEPRALTIEEKAFKLHIGGGDRLFHLEYDGGMEQAMVKDVQWDTWGHLILHADFSRIADDDRLTITVPVRLTGASQLDLRGGVLLLDQHSLSLRALVTNVPSEIVIDVTGLEPGKSITVGELELPKGVELAGAPDDSVVRIQEARGGDASQGEEGEGEAAEGGEAPAADAPAGD